MFYRIVYKRFSKLGRLYTSGLIMVVSYFTQINLKNAIHLV